MPEPPRRFPAPWHADPMPGGYAVRDANGQTLAFVYSRDSDARLLPQGHRCPARGGEAFLASVSIHAGLCNDSWALENLIPWPLTFLGGTVAAAG
jgi:hypothetical protein